MKKTHFQVFERLFVVLLYTINIPCECIVLLDYKQQILGKAFICNPILQHIPNFVDTIHFINRDGTDV